MGARRRFGRAGVGPGAACVGGGRYRCTRPRVRNIATNANTLTHVFHHPLPPPPLSLSLSLSPPPPLPPPPLSLSYRFADKKGADVRAFAPEVVSAIFASTPTNCLPVAILRSYTEGKAAALGNAAKWQTKVGALEILSTIAKANAPMIATIMPQLVPAVQDAMWETKKQVKDAAKVTMADICTSITNDDLSEFVEDMIEAIIDRDQLTETIDALGSTTFVQPFDAAALSLATPILEKGFKRVGEVATQRKCGVITENMAKLVMRPIDAEYFAATLMPYLAKGIETMSDPEARDRFEKAHAEILKVTTQDFAEGEIRTTTAADVLTTLDATLGLAGNKAAQKARAGTSAYIAGVAQTLTNTPTFLNADWAEALAPVVSTVVASGAAGTTALQQACCTAAGGEMNVNRAAVAEVKEDDQAHEDRPDVCDLQFSLAYGTNILLNNARLHMKRGLKYGVIASKSAGKTTMMRAITNGQVDGFPSAEECRTIFIENDIQGTQLAMNTVEYLIDSVGFGIELGNDEARAACKEGGFTDVMCDGPITSLSGGWKMKLALIRATIQNGDILFMDEPTNHLDVINVQWVVDYLNSDKLAQTTCVIVSHDTKFLDLTVSQIIHFDNLKLHMYAGNITDFVARFPWAKSYFELGSSKIKFQFPEPVTLMGAKGRPIKKGTPIMSMKDCTFTYPGAAKPQMSGVTVMLSMVSRVAIVGANGAGKSTMIKLLTGENEPQTGIVKKNANMRFAYVAQHAFHHIEQHLDKSPNDYIRWRYETGDDKEALQKATFTVTDEEKAKMYAVFEYSWKDEISEKQMKEKRSIEKLVTRKTEKKKYMYEIKYKGKPASFNTWHIKEYLVEKGWLKHVNALDARMLALEGMQQRPLTRDNVEKHLANVGLDSEYGSHSRIRDLSGGQKVKVVLAACTWACPHIIILDEPTNYLDRDSLGALATAIKEFGGGVCLITHHKEFAEATTRETWVVANNRCDVQGDPEWEKYAAEDHGMEEKADEYTDANGNTHKIKVVIKIEDMSKKDVKKYKKIITNKIKNGLELDEQEQGWADAWDIDWD